MTTRDDREYQLSSETDDPFLAELVADLANRLAEGQSLDLEEYADRYPDRAEPLRRIWPTLRMMAALGGSEGGSGPRSARMELNLGEGSRTLGDYRLLHELGRGGMGVVYEAEQISLGRRVALKVLPFAAAVDSKQQRRFQLEAQAAGCLHHTNIVPVHAVGCERGVSFYVMQLIQGRSLAQVIAELRRLDGLEPAGVPVPVPVDAMTATLASRLTAGSPPYETNPSMASPQAAMAPESLEKASTRPTPSTQGRAYVRGAARLALQAAEALDHAHSRGILHRDIKPGDLLLDADGNLWVTDFGLAQIQGDSRLTLTGDLLGTLRYMSPEQALARRVVIDGRTDVYSLGVTLYELLTLRPAFDGVDRAEILRRIAEREPASLRKLNPSVPPDLETIVRKATEKDPSRRYSTAGELAADLRRFLEARPITARRVGPAERLARWGARNPWIAGLAASVFALSTVTAVIASTMAVRLQEKAAEVKGEAGRANQALDEVRRSNSGLVATQDRLRRTLYSARIGLAQGAWDANNVGRMIDLLEPRNHDPGEMSRRGFEWQYLWRLSHSELDSVALRDFRPIGFTSFSPDGTRVAAVVRDGRRLCVRVWDTSTGEIRLNLGGPPADPDHIVLENRPVFSGDGRRVAAALTVGLDGSEEERREITVWDAVTGAVVRTISERVESRVVGLALSPDGKRLAATVGPGRLDPVTPIIPRGRLLLWDLETGRVVLEPPGGGWFGFLAFGPDGKQVAVAGLTDPDGKAPPLPVVQLWSVESGEPGLVFAAPGYGPGGVAFSPDGRLLSVSWFSGAETGRLVVYEIASGRETYAIPEVTGWFEHAVFSPDSKRLTRASREEPTAMVWDVARGGPPLVRKGHASLIGDVAFSPDGARLYTVAGDATVKTWDVRERVDPVPPPLRGKSGLDVALCARGFFAATLANDRNRYDELVVVDPAGHAVSRIERQGYDIGFTTISPDGTKVAAIEYRDGGRVEVRAWEVDGGRELWSFPGPKLGSTSAYRFDLTFSPDGSRLAATFASCRREGDGLSTELRAWDTGTGRPLLELVGGPGDFTSVAYSPDGRRIASGQRNGAGVSRIRLWDAISGRPLLTMEGHETPINWLAFSPDGLSVASCSGDDSGIGDVRVWDATTGGRRLTMTGHAHGVSMVTFSADGRRIATTGRALASDGEVKLWDASTGLELLTLRSRAGSVNRVAFTVDGTRLLAAGIVSVARREDPVEAWDASPVPGR